MTRMSIDVPLDMHKMIKYSATFHEQTIREYVIEAIRKRLSAERVKTPNATTRRTMKKTDQAKELHAYKSYDDFLKEMGFVDDRRSST